MGLGAPLASLGYPVACLRRTKGPLAVCASQAAEGLAACNAHTVAAELRADLKHLAGPP